LRRKHLNLRALCSRKLLASEGSSKHGHSGGARGLLGEDERSLLPLSQRNRLGFRGEPITGLVVPLSQWLHAAMTQADLAAELLETRHVRTAFKTMPVKTDKKDAAGSPS
jgi:hypothetical protein